MCAASRGRGSRGADGAVGVVGLTTALKLQEKGGYSVTIIAEIFPNDPLSIKYTSNWAVRLIIYLAGSLVEHPP